MVISLPDIFLAPHCQSPPPPPYKLHENRDLVCSPPGHRAALWGLNEFMDWMSKSNKMEIMSWAGEKTSVVHTTVLLLWQNYLYRDGSESMFPKERTFFSPNTYKIDQRKVPVKTIPPCLGFSWFGGPSVPGQTFWRDTYTEIRYT